MPKVELNIIALANSESSPGNYVIILEEATGNRRLPIVIGGFEAQAIAVALEKMKPRRPLTHDLFKHTLTELGASLKEVVIHGLIDGVFHAYLLCETSDGQLMEIDCRSSDAIALAVRFSCPIFTEESVMDEVGILNEESDPSSSSGPLKSSASSSQSSASFKDQSLSELETLLESLLSKEDYEQAAKVRDEIEKRKGNK
ncbi:MAG: bifunctional nuclease family protein [Bacteroidota bacterium]